MELEFSDTLSGQVAGHPLLRNDLPQQRALDAATFLSHRASGMKRATGWWVDGGGHVSCKNDSFALGIRFHGGHS